MKKFIFVCLFIFVGFVSSQVYAWEAIGDDAWNELRILHAEYLGQPNYTEHDTTKKWIAQDMNTWLKKKKNEYEGRIRTLEKENQELLKNSTNTPTGEDDSNTGASVIEQNQHLTKANNELENKFNCCKIERNIAYSVIAIILVLFIAFILIKKCQAKKLPKVIEEAIAAQDK